MSKVQIPFVLAWMAIAATFPLRSQTFPDASGVTVVLKENHLLHRTPVQYPLAARLKGIQGNVLLEATLDEKGNVADATVLSGPLELRRVCLEAVLQWHFAPGAANSVRQVNIQFAMNPDENRPRLPMDFRPSIITARPAPQGFIGKRIRSIEVLGLPPAAQTELRGKLPVREGDVLSMELAESTGHAVRDFDEHLTLGFPRVSDTEASIRIAVPGYSADLLAPPAMDATSRAPVRRIRAAGNVQAVYLVHDVVPVYPALAKQAHIQGTVRLTAIIGAQGAVQSVQLVSGHPLLVEAAVEAVRQWTYKPAMLNGQPVEVVTDVAVNFTLPPE